MSLQDEIAAFDRDRAALEAQYFGEWVVFHSGELIGHFKRFDDAAAEAVERFGAGPYLIRQVGTDAIQLSSAMVFRPAHAHGPSGL